MGEVKAEQSRMVVLYDGACKFCRCCVAMFLLWDRAGRLTPVAIQSADGQRLLAPISPVDRLRSAHLVTADGRVLSGAAAAPELLRALPFGGPFAVVTAALMPLTKASYGFVARLRGVVGPMLPAAWCSSADRLIADRRRGITPPTAAR